VTRLDDALAGVRHIGVDSAPIIYHVEGQARYAPLMAAVFQRIANGRIDGTTSVVTLVEALTHPRARGDVQLAEVYRDLLLDSEHFHTLAIDAAVAELAADLRASYRLRTPDALQVAVALAEGCELFLTNDARLQRITEIPILLLDDLEL